MRTLIILHGWQSSKEKWQKVKENIESNEIEVIIPDLPGFKPEAELQRPWNLDDYVEWLKDFSQERERACPELAEGFFLLGHSFGGRIAIKFAAKYSQKLYGLILISAAGIKKEEPSISKITPIFKKLSFLPGYYFFRKLFYCYILRKTDYLEASGFLKETIKNILEEDLTPLLNKIYIPTLIIWGEKDKITPLNDAGLMKEKIKFSQLEILSGTGHTPHLENPELLAKKIKDFI